jgi:heavy metal translocating P-type ATPase
MNALLARVPHSASRYTDGTLETVPLAAIRPGDRLLVPQGEVVPVDGDVAEGRAVLDQSAISGESVPVTRQSGEPVQSGSVNVAAAFDLLATRTADESTYAAIVRLVETATRSKAPATRMADRFAVGFTLVTAVLALIAWWAAGDPVRAVAVLVVATPCPLILAVPVAIVAGISQAAGRGVLVKGGAALESLGRVRTLVIDKTGTLTEGAASLLQVRPAPGFQPDEVLRLAGSLDQASRHAVARSLAAAAVKHGLTLTPPAGTVESPGEGLEGQVGAYRVRVGGVAYVAGALSLPDSALNADDTPPGALTVAVAVDGRFAGLILMRDGLREGIPAIMAALRKLGIGRVVLATGDRRDVAMAVTEGLGFDDVTSDLAPTDKIAVVRREQSGGPVMMVGDGVNDAPALVEADIGVAMGAKGAAASAEAADIVLLRDSLEGLVDGLRIARRTRSIALQSVVVGLSLSLAGMIAAAAGYLPAVQGALLQEAIDVAVILNALRALRPGPA